MKEHFNDNFGLTQKKSSRKILFLSPHTDDAELGSGGTLIKSVENLHDIMVVVFSAGSHHQIEDEPKSVLKSEFKDSMKDVEVQNYKIFNFNLSLYRYADSYICAKYYHCRTGFSRNRIKPGADNTCFILVKSKNSCSVYERFSRIGLCSHCYGGRNYWTRDIGCFAADFCSILVDWPKGF